MRPAAWLLLLIAGCGSRAEVRAEIDITARPETVWAVLGDVTRYGEWNPLTPRIDGTLAVGNDVTLHVQLRSGEKQRLQKQRITRMDPGRVIVWETKVGTKAMLRAERTQTLTPLVDGCTRYETVDRFSGGLVPLVMRLYRRDLERRFAEVASALKARAERSRAAGTLAPRAGAEPGRAAELSAEVLRRREP